MALLTTVAAAVKLADVLGIDDWLGELIGGEPGEQAAGKIMDVAKVVTGSAKPEEIIRQVERSADVKLELKRALLSQAHELKLAAFEDKKSARGMYQATDHKMADKIADRIIDINPKLIILLVLIDVCVIMWIDNPAIALTVGNVVGASITYLWQERQAVVNFFFGSSLGSKDKARQLAVKD